MLHCYRLLVSKLNPIFPLSMETIWYIFPSEMDKSILKEIALSQRAIFEKKTRGLDREALSSVAGHISKPHVITISGVRRCGKSTLLLQIADRHFNKDFYYFNFEDERLVDFTPKDFSALHEALIECFGSHKTFFMDEVQNVAGWERFVRRMQDEGFKFILTGSNASLLSSELGTKLTGRHVGIELLPFSFKEFVTFKKSGVSKDDFLSPEGRARINTLFAEYLTHGGFPEYLKFDDVNVLTQLYDDIIYRDVASRHDIKNTRMLRELALYYMSNVSALCSFNKLKTALGAGSVTTISAYTGHFEQSYLLSTTNILDPSVKRQMIAPKKIYAIDTGLAANISLSFSMNLGALTENLVFLELVRRNAYPGYYKTRNGLEVDFVCTTGRRVDEAIQVAYSIADPATRERELAALAGAAAELGLNHGLLLSDQKEEEIVRGSSRIKIMPVAKWLLA